MESLRVTLVQTELFWEDKNANLQNFTKILEGLTDATDLVVLPEMFNSGFTMRPERVAETEKGHTVTWLKTMAGKLQAAITGSLVIEENSNYYNRLFFVFPDGSFQTYDKKHTFTLAGEHKAYASGKERLLVTYKDWKICPLICYDLRFPVWARNTQEYDLLLYVANWPQPRILAWDALLKARAIENMAYCIGVNRIGKDVNQNIYSGHSAAYDVLGNTLFFSEKEAAATVTLKKEHIGYYRDKLKFLQDRDNFILK
ncbi:amidohydrolase [Ascidiimonas aurantiaca]|uniref:amidohydrolase n=1 Tax=Ascidiimonas aurantiaca TaxID=1685432 RepID=UPI0030EF0EF1